MEKLKKHQFLIKIALIPNKYLPPSVPIASRGGDFDGGDTLLLKTTEKEIYESKLPDVEISFASITWKLVWDQKEV